MYPLTEGLTYAYNQWYVAGWSDEFSRALLERSILGESLVFYRTQEGLPVALRNQCPHRGFPLAKGRLDGDEVECAYHGLTFDGAGKCVHVPSQSQIPPTFKVQSYPVQERWKWVWIWMGDPALADPALIPDVRWLKAEEPGWRATVGGTLDLKARYMLPHENLLDLSHLTYLHNRNIGSRGVATTKVEFEVTSGRMDLWRHVKSDEFENAPLGRLLGVEGLVDRKMEQQFFPPNLHVTGPAFSSALEGGIDPGRPFGGFRVLHAITPASEHRTHYFWGFCRDFALQDDALDETMRTFLEGVALEDVVASEEIERLLQADGGRSTEISCLADAPGIRGRRMMQELIQKDPPRRPVATRPAAT